MKPAVPEFFPVRSDGASIIADLVRGAALGFGFHVIRDVPALRLGAAATGLPIMRVCVATPRPSAATGRRTAVLTPPIYRGKHRTTTFSSAPRRWCDAVRAGCALGSRRGRLCRPAKHPWNSHFLGA